MTLSLQEFAKDYVKGYNSPKERATITDFVDAWEDHLEGNEIEMAVDKAEEDVFKIERGDTNEEWVVMDSEEMEIRYMIRDDYKDHFNAEDHNLIYKNTPKGWACGNKLFSHHIHTDQMFYRLEDKVRLSRPTNGVSSFNIHRTNNEPLTLAQIEMCEAILNIDPKLTKKFLNMNEKTREFKVMTGMFKKYPHGTILKNIQADLYGDGTEKVGEDLIPLDVIQDTLRIWFEEM